MERLFKIRCSAIGQIMGKLNKEGELPKTCTTYLHTWYANDNEQIHSKYMDKGNAVESDLIDFMATELGYGMAEKCIESASNEFIQGSCDVVTHDAIIDVKASWNKKTLHQQVLDGLDKDYEFQLQGYMHLYNRTKAVLFFGLMNTPETNWSEEIVYEDMPSKERWLAYHIDYNPEVIKAIEERVMQCRAYLIEYDTLLKSKLGKIN